MSHAQDHYMDRVVVRLQEKVAEQASAIARLMAIIAENDARIARLLEGNDCLPEMAAEIKRLMSERDGTREENARLRAWAEDEQRGRHKAEDDRVSIRGAWSGAVEVLKLQEAAEQAHLKCSECEGEEIPELCPKCFPLYDDARIKRRMAIAKAGRMA